MQAEAKKADANLNILYKLVSLMAIMLFVLTFLVMGGTSLNLHLPSLAIDHGFTAETGALLLSISMIGNLISKFIVGVVIDRKGVFTGFILVLSTTILGYFLILISKGSTLPLLAGGFLYGTIFSLGSLGMSILTRYLYGHEQYGKVYATVMLITCVGSSVFITLIGALYDLTGSYRVPVIMSIAIAAIALGLIFWMIAKVSKIKKVNG